MTISRVQGTLMAMPLTVVIFGATGDLAKKKLFPALYKLCIDGHLPRHLNIVGYGRRAVEMEGFLAKQCVNVAEDPRWAKADFYQQISFHAGGYDEATSYAALSAKLQEYEDGHESMKGRRASVRTGNRLFFMSVPPAVFGTVAEMVSAHCRAGDGGFTRLMIEKPFGHDLESFQELNDLTARHFKEVRPSPAADRGSDPRT